MRKTALLMLGLACVLGVISVYLANDWIKAQSAGDDGIELTKVVVARQQLHVGDPVVAEVLSEVQWPAAARPEGSFHSIGELIGDGVQNRVALRPIEPNEPILKPRVSGFGGRATLSALLSNDKRAFTIRANDVVGVGGFVLPGDRVDVLLTRSDNDRNSRTDIILQNIKVLGVDQEASEDRNKPHVAKAVTLEVTAVEAQKLALASSAGLITLALRNEANSNMVAADALHLDDLGANRSVASSPAKPVSGKGVRVSKRDPYADITVFRALESSVNKVARESATHRAASPAPTARTPTRLQPEASSEPGLGVSLGASSSKTPEARTSARATDDATEAFIAQIENALRRTE